MVIGPTIVRSDGRGLTISMLQIYKIFLIIRTQREKNILESEKDTQFVTCDF